jgi:hypothetical protein
MGASSGGEARRHRKPQFAVGEGGHERRIRGSIGNTIGKQCCKRAPIWGATLPCEGWNVLAASWEPGMSMPTDGAVVGPLGSRHEASGMDAGAAPWSNVREPVIRDELRAIYAALLVELGTTPTRPHVLRWTKLTAEACAATYALSEEAAQVALRRHYGRGRRPTRQLAAQMAKRQALQVETCERMLRTLRELASAPTRSSSADSSLGERLLSLPRSADGNGAAHA